MLCLENDEKMVVCETAYHDQEKPVNEWPEWKEEFYNECPSSMYRVPYNKEGFIPLFFETDTGRLEYDVAAVGQAILKHMVLHRWFPLCIFNTTILQNMCGLTLNNTVTSLQLLRMIQTTHCYETRLVSLVDMLVKKSREIDSQGWSNIELATTMADDNVDKTESLFHNFGLHTDQHLFVVDAGSVVTTTEEMVLHHSSVEFRIRRLLSNWFCAWPYYHHFETVPEFHHQHYKTRNVHIADKSLQSGCAGHTRTNNAESNVQSGNKEDDKVALKTAHIKAIKNIFNQFDKDKSGTIEKKELATLCIALNDPLSPPELHDFFNQVDADNSGRITWQEFINYWKSK